VRILYDGKIFQLQVAGGVNRYFANVIAGLPPDFSPVLIADWVQDVNYPSHRNLKIYQLGKMRLPNLSYRLSVYTAQAEDALRTRALAQRADVCHPTYYSRLTDVKVSCPTVITVWDMIDEIFSRDIDPTGRNAEQKRRAITSAQHVICISESTKKDLLETYPISESIVSVTHLASSIDARQSHGAEPTPARPYYVYVGSRATYKNFDRVLRAFARAIQAQPDLALCVVGTVFDEREQGLIDDLKLVPHLEHFGHPSDSHLAKLYRCSLALVYPSLYEGFGIPPLEAMACGTVAIVSNVSSLPEVVGDAGILFDPRSEDELAQILVSLPDDETRRAKLIERGAARVQKFSWQKTVEQTVEIYKSLA
jgi:glycosyltransferase involved in cell wall biosynthesis